MPTPHTTTGTRIDSASRRVQVLLPLPLAGPYDYRVPDGLAVEPGAFVLVPLGARETIGVVWSETGSGEVPDAKLRDLGALLDAPALPETTRRFVDWVAEYYLAPAGAVLRMAMNVPAALESPPTRTAYRLAAIPEDLRMTAARKRVLDVLADGLARPMAALAREAAAGAGVISGLARAGALEAVALPEPGVPTPDPNVAGPALSPDQRRAAEALTAGIADGGFSVTLLDGVTGSGKTEVYFEATAEALRRKRQVLVLLPEIALTEHWLARFARRFGAAPVAWHSGLTQKQRRRVWRAVADGTASVIVGARSALFLPYARLGLVIVDEEHDTSFKQEDGVAYNARDMAVVRARLDNAPALLVSATPSLETLANVARGRYRRLALPARHGAADLPAVSVLDLRRTPPPSRSWIAPPLRDALAEVLEAGEQALLFLNRRGYAPLTLCRACGFRYECPNCTAWLVEHRLARRLECHHCGYVAPYPSTCAQCGAEDSLVACGPGVERLSEEVQALLPQARVASLTSDTLRIQAASLLDQVEKREVDILIGTQVVAKGHHFPMLTLVGVIDADLGLSGGDLRAAERTFQLLHQVAGRAGRADRPGRVMIQTYNPDHPVIVALAAGERDRFLAEEAAERETGGWPPYGRLAAVILSGRDREQVDQVAQRLARAAPRHADIRVLGPAPAPLAILRGRHRRRFLAKAGRAVDLQALLRRWLAAVRLPSAVRLQIDIDPYSFL